MIELHKPAATNGFRNCLEAGWIGFEPLQDLEYVDLNIIAQVLEQSIKLPLPQHYRHDGIYGIWKKGIEHFWEEN